MPYEYTYQQRLFRGLCRGLARGHDNDFPISPSPGDWVHILHSVLRRKARCEATGETVSPVTTDDFRDEAARFQKASSRLVTPSGNYV